MLMERRVKFRSSQNISGASLQNSEAAFEVDGELFLISKKKLLKDVIYTPYESLCEKWKQWLVAVDLMHCGAATLSFIGSYYVL